MENVRSHPAEVVEINGTATGPWPPGAASSFTYTVDICLPSGMQRKTGVKPNVERWPDSQKVNPIRIGTLVTVYVIGDKVVMADRELPFTEECPPPGGGSARSSTNNIRELLATVAALSWDQKADLRRALGV